MGIVWLCSLFISWFVTGSVVGVLLCVGLLFGGMGWVWVVLLGSMGWM